MKIYIRQLVCPHCKLLLNERFKQAGLQNSVAEENGSQIVEANDDAECQKIYSILADSKLEVITDRKSLLAQQVRNEIIYQVYLANDPLNINLSVYLSEKFHRDYTYLANLFSDIWGMTLEKYHISQKIERVKQLIVYDFTVTEIAEMMSYSSVAHLSAQFKKATGFTPTYYKKLMAGLVKNPISINDLYEKSLKVQDKTQIPA